MDIFKSVERVNAALESDEDFVHFWNKHCVWQSETADYFSGSTKPIGLSYVVKMSIEYGRFLRERKLSDTSESTRKKIQAEFDAIRPSLCQGFLEKEAVRLNSDMSEVRPVVPVLPLVGFGRQSELCSLSDDIFAKIMKRLEAIDIFRVSHVCKQWRYIVHQNASTLTRAEHSLFSHLLTFTQWMDPACVVKGKDFREHYQSFGWSLIQWCCNLSHNIETLVLHDLDCSNGRIPDLLKRCPNLKHLHFKSRFIDMRSASDFQLPKLETLIIEDLRYLFTSEFTVHVFTTSCRLQVFKGQLEIEDIKSINRRSLSQNAFSNLIALQIFSVSFELLENLATLDQLQLKYLYLWDSLRHCQFRHDDNQHWIDKKRNALHRLLSKQNQLEVLVSLWAVDIDEKTIKLMTEQQQNLKSALLSFRFTSLENEGGFDSSDGRVHIDDQNSLVYFEEMLLEKDPSRDMSDFVFLIQDEKSRSLLEDAMTGFSIYEGGNQHSDMFEKWSLSHPAMRRILGIDF